MVGGGGSCKKRPPPGAREKAGAPPGPPAGPLLPPPPPDAPPAPATKPPDWAVDWLLRTGRELAYRSPEVAADLLGHAVSHLSADDRRRETLQVVLAAVLVLLGRNEEVRTLAKGVLATTEEPGHAAEMSWNLAWALAAGARYAEAREAMEHALRAPDLDVRWAARLRGLLARILGMTGEHELAAMAAEQARADAGRAGDRPTAAAAMHALALSRHYHRGDPAGALELYERALAGLGDDASSADLRLVLLHNQAVMLFDVGRTGETEAAMRELLRVAERSASPPRLATMRLGVAAHHYFMGRWDDALAEIEAMSDVSDRLPNMNQMWQHGIAALIAVHRDAPVGAEHAGALDRLLAGGVVTGVEFPMLARVTEAERAGDPEQALTVLRNGLDPVSHLAMRDVWLPLLVRLALANGDRGLAADAAKACDDDLAAAPAGRPLRAAAQRCRGLVDGDGTLLIAAADAYRDMGRAIELAQTLEDAAVVLAHGGDRAAARAAYAEATERYAAMRATWDLRRADTRLRPLGLRRQRAPRRHATTGWDALTPTELDIAHLVAQGLPNPDIATRLYSSRRTVEVHVSHILTKLEVRSRVEIAREVARHSG